MPRRVKNEERIEMIIRGLLKQPENRRCVNCNSLGPQYICTTFWTFVCTICSGVHREFTHRVKSVSMAKFNDEEISSLQAGGNERAKEIYFKTWDPHRHPYPDGGNLYSLREFIRHVYIDRKYAGENNNIAMVMLDSRNSNSERRSYEKSEFFERQFSEISSNSSSREDQTDRCTFDPTSPFKRNGGVITFRDILEERSPRKSYESSGSQRHRPATRFEIVDDRFRDDGSVKRYDHRYSSSKSVGSRSPVSQTSAPANVRPVLKIEGPPKYNERNEASATIRGPTGAAQKQNEAVKNPNSLMDSDATPGPTDNPPERQAITPSHNNSKELSSPIAISSATQTTPPNKDSLESWLFDLPDPVSSPPADTPRSDGSKATDGAHSTDIVPVGGQPLDDSSKDRTVQVMNHTSSYAREITASHGEPFYSQSNNSRGSNELTPVQNVPHEQSSQATNHGDLPKSTARKEIPQDLFSFTPAVSGWQMHPPYGTGYGMQYHPPGMPVAAFPNPSRPINPFDVGADGYQAQSTTPSPYARAMPPHMSPYGMNISQVPGAYMEQLPNNMQFTRPQGSNANIGNRDNGFAYTNQMQHTSEANSSPNPSLSRTGNPFG